MVAVYTPAGMEGWFREVCTPIDDHATEAPPITPELIERMLEAGPRHNVEWAPSAGLPATTKRDVRFSRRALSMAREAPSSAEGFRGSAWREANWWLLPR